MNQDKNQNQIVEPNKKVSSVQYFWDSIALGLSVEQINLFLPIFTQAKQMHREEIKQAWSQYVMSDKRTFDDYYNDTYKK